MKLPSLTVCDKALGFDIKSLSAYMKQFYRRFGLAPPRPVSRGV